MSRRQFSAGFKKTLVALFFQSGRRNMTQFCKDYNVCVNSLYLWISQEKQGKLTMDNAVAFSHQTSVARYPIKTSVIQTTLKKTKDNV